MNKKQIFLGICLFIVFLSALSVVSASDLVDNGTVSTANDDLNTISVTNNQKNILRSSPGTFADLNDTINGQSPVSLNADYSYSSSIDVGLSKGIEINKSITIDGQGFTLDAKNNASIFRIGPNCHVVLKNINFVNARGEKGGAIYVDSLATLEIIDCNFTNNTATTSGGAIYIDNTSSITSNFKISGSTFNNNTARFGGAVYLYGNSTDISTIKNSTFINCNSGGDGGAAYISATNVEFRDLIFENNIAGDDGGAVYWEGSNGKIYNITCIDNKGISVGTSSTRGGTIIITGSNIIVSNSRFKKGSAYMNSYKDYSKVDGGALFITGNDVVVSNTTFDLCSATNNGGAIYVIGNRTNISGCDFNDCTGRDGGALFVNGSDCTLYNSTFAHNVANDDGGAIFWQGDNGYIYNITCVDNKGISGYDTLDGKYSNTRGGTICLTGSNVILTQSSFTLSSAYMDERMDYSKVDGGALFITGNDVVVSNTTFDLCSATNNGGAIYVIGNRTNISGCDFNDCTGRDGGALFVNGDDCTLYNSTFTNNIANDDGGAVYWEGDNGYMYNVTLINNKGVSGYDPLEGKYSNSKGGTICLTGSNVTIDKSSFNTSSAKSDGGALFITGNDVKVLHSDFSDSISTDSSGGAVYIIGNDTQIFDCTFDDCTVDVSSDHRGGAIYVAGNDANITKSSFTNTKALVGGAIYISGDNTIVDDSRFMKNDASSKNNGGTGGAINIDGANAIITNSDFSQGTAVNYGGAIAVWGPNAQIINNTFENSKTTKYNGGAIFVSGTNTTISLSNFTQCNALGDKFARGGAIDVEGDDASILDCNFDDCDSHYGGVIYVSGANANINSSTFKDSEAYQGGAIYVEGTNTSISSSNFTDISADNYGGSIYVAGANANISQSNFIRSTVKNYNGGAIYIAGENTNIEKSNFNSARATNSRNKALGGAIYVEGANAVIKESDFDDCKASEGGGAIYAYGNEAIIEDSTFNSSTAKYGGAIYLTSWGSSITRSNITGSTATQNGGGVYVAEGSIQISESNFDYCIASGTTVSNGGGAIYINGPDTHISASNFSGNKAPNSAARGGAIFINGERTVIEGSEFDNSIANQGGVIFIEGKDAIIDTSSFSNSSSKGAGGSIYVKGDEATIRLSSFDNITASNGDGGAIYVDGEKTDILNSSFYNCTVKGKKGGAIYIDDLGTTVAYSNFTLSKAAEAGAIYIHGENTTISYCNLDHNVANTAGAIKVFGDDTIISNSNFTYNIAKTSTGGALDIGGANASVYYSWFDHNDAKLEGGAINWLGGHGDDSIIGSTFTNNRANGTSRGGGAIYWTQGLPIASGGLIKDSIFINNTAAGKHGGAIDWFQALDSVIDNCLFINNTASSDGGALYTGDQAGNSVNLTITNSQFYNNTAKKHGGAISNQMANSHIFNNIFDGNKAMAGGGTILMKEGPAHNCVIDHCYIFNSYVGYLDAGYGGGGGAILLGVKGDSNITISNSVIMNSTIGRGPGGAIAIFGSDCSIINVSIEDTSTKNDDGGAIYLKGANGNMDNVTIFNASTHSTGGSKSSDGGAIHVSGWYSTLNDIKIFMSSANNDENCAKTNYGGAIYVGGSYDVLTNIIIDDSNSTNVKMNAGGGAIFYDGYGGTLINATISNTLATGNGGAIYWKGSTPIAINNISITYSKTEVIDSANSADGGAFYSTTVDKLNNVTINGASAYKNTGDVKGGAIYLKDASTLNNVTVIGSRASTDSGTSRGGAAYFEKTNNKPGNVYVYNSSFEENNADLGGGLYFEKVTAHIYDTSFEYNVANRDGGAIYSQTEDEYLYTSTFEHNSAKNGGAIFSQNGQIQGSDSTFEFNTAEEKGGAIYYNYDNRQGQSVLLRVNLLNNTAFQGSAMYATKLNKMSLIDTTLLDNQANSNKFVEKAVGVDEQGNNYTSAVFLGFDNLLNAIWQESTYSLSCTNVTYWGIDGRTITNSPPTQTDREVNIAVTVEMYDENGVQLKTADLFTDKDGKVTYNFDAEEGKTYYFAYVHQSGRNYTYLRDTLSNSSLVKIYVYTPIYYGQNQTILISLTDGAWGNLNGTVIVTLNDTQHTTFTFDVVNGSANKTGISNLPIGHYNATASFAGDLNHTGDTDWVLFDVLPYDDLEITKEVNITADYLNVSDTIKYTITVTNHGPSKAYGVNVTERLSPYLKLINSKATTGIYNLTGGYWHIGELDVNDFETLTIVAEIIHMGPITNTVWVTGLGKDINMTNNVDSAHNFTAVPIIDLRIGKGINDTRKVINVLDKIKFVITVVNDGPCNATGVIVEELLDDHLKMISNVPSIGVYENGTWNIGNLSKGERATLTIEAQVVYSGNISNTVHVSAYENESNYNNNYAAIKNIAAIANVDLQINKYVNVSDAVNVTDKIKFVITVTNNGPCNTSGVYVAETLSPLLKVISYNASIGDWDGSTWVVGKLNNGEVHNLTIIAEVISAGTISNAVSIVGNDNDTNKSNNEDKIKNITSSDIVDLEIHKTVDVESRLVNVSDRIIFTIKVKNNGPCDATNVSVSEVLSHHLRLIDYSTWASNYDVDKGIWYIGNLANGDWRELVITAEVISAGTISNVVVVNSTETDTNKSNNKDEIPNITARDVVDLKIKKEINVTGYTVNVTDYIKYTITVFNDGPSNATNVYVNETLSPCLKLIKSDATIGSYNSTGGYWYIGELKNQSTAVLTIEAQVIGNGTIKNVVVANSTEIDSDPSDNRAEVDIFAVYIVDLQIKKEVFAPSTVGLNTEIVFNITVYNAGPCNATGVYVCEPLSYNLIYNYTLTQGTYDDRYTWNIGNMTSGSTATLTIYAKVAYVGTIENAVEVTCNEFDTNLTNNKDNITPINVTDKVDLGINKTVNVSVVNVSDWVEFTIVAYNNCSLNAGGVYVLEALDFNYLGLDYTFVASEGTTYDGYTWYIDQLNAGAKATLNITARVIKAGNFSNYVEIFVYNDNNTSNNNYTVNVTARPVVDLGITKEVNVTDVVYYNDTIKFTITVVNNGPCDATGVYVNETLDSHLKLVDYYAKGTSYDVDTGVWDIGDLAKDDSRQLEIVARVISLGNISNAVSVTSWENDTNKSNNNASIPNITAKPIVDLQIKKEVNVTGDVIAVTDYIKFTITVNNDGPSNATNVNVTEVLSPHLKLNKFETDNGYYNLTGGYWYIGNLTSKSKAVLTLYSQVISEGIISNEVTVNGTEKDTNTSNNKDEIDNITAVIVFDLQIKKEVNTTTNIDITDSIKYTITVYNAGPCNATDVYVSEPLSDKLVMTGYNISCGAPSWYDVNSGIWYIGNLDNGSSVTLTIDAEISHGGIIENKVNVTGRGIDTDLSNNKANVILNATAHVDLGVVKWDDVKDPRVVNVGELVSFTITAFNNGPCNASEVYVLETLDSHLELVSFNSTKGTYNGRIWDIGNLNVREVVVLRIVARVIAPGNFSNYVEITSPDNDTVSTNNKNRTANITANPIVDLEIEKEVDVTDVVYYGDEILFTITVRNNGPCDATNVNVTEKLSPILELVGWTGDGSYDVGAGVWDIGKLDKYDYAQLFITAKVIGLGNITNVVSVNSTENDANESNNNASIPNITVIPIVDLRIQKTVNVNTTEVNVTDILVFTITVWNDGPCNSTDTYVYEPLSDCLRLLNYTVENNTSNPQWYDGYTWLIGNLTSGTNTTLTIVAQIAYSGTIENYVNVTTSNETELDPSNNEDWITPLHATTQVDLAINKTSNVTDSVNVGDLVEFTIVACNNGPCNASGVYVLEALDFDHFSYDYTYVASKGTTYDGYTWYIDHLDAGANVTLKITARVREPGNVSNYVEIFGYDHDANQSNNNATVNFTAVPVVDLEITKDVDVGDEVLVGQKVVFTITVKNNGPSDATNVNVTEVLSNHLEMIEYITWDSYYDVDEGVWYIGDLARYDWRQIIIVTEVVSVGNISNAVSVISTENDTNKSNNNDTIPNITAKPAVDLQILKDVNVTSRFVEVYDLIEYTVTVYNDGPCNATNVNVTEALSSYLKYVGSETEFGYYNSTGGYWYVGDLAKGVTANLTIVAKVIRDGNVIPNVVIATSAENDTNPYNNRDEVIIASLPIVDLRITKEVNASEVSVTDYIEFTITVYNDGPCNVTGAYVLESLSDNLRLISYVASQGDWKDSTWNFDNVTVGANVTLTIVAQVVYSGNFSNVVVVYAYQNETNYTNNNASVNITAVNNVDLRITKDVNVSGVVNVTDRIKFTITVTNDGPCNATGVYVSEVLNPRLKIISNQTSIGEYRDGTWVIGDLTKGETHNLTIVAEVISSGTISNVVSIISSGNDTNKSNNNASIENLTAVNIVDLGINKTVDVTGVVSIGDRIVFTVTVWNNGPCDATNVNVTEKLSHHLELVEYYTWDSYYDVDDGIWYVGCLAKNDWKQLIIVTEVVSVGNISNAVSVVSTENDTNKSNNNASIPNITAVDVVDLAITKDVNVEGTVLVGQTIVFIVTVRNNGQCDATNVNVTEVLSPHVRMIGYSTWDSYYNVTEGVWYIGTLAKNDWRQLIIVTEVVSVGNISNAVSVVSTENDTNKSNNNASIPNITADPAVDLYITKTVNVSGVVNIGDVIEFDIVVYNGGPCNATNVNVSEVLSPHLKLINNITENGYYDADDGVWYIGNLTNQNRAYLSIIAQVISTGTISNVVVATSSENDTDYSTNKDEIDNITAIYPVDLSIIKTVSTTSARIGDEITYVIEVHNHGPRDATDVIVSEKLSKYVSLIKSTADRGEYDESTGIWNIGTLKNNETLTLTLTVRIIALETIENFVSINSTGNDTNPYNNNYTSDNVTVERLDTPIMLIPQNITYGDDEVLVVVLPTNVAGTVNITVNGKPYDNVPINSGIVELIIPDLAAGDYNITVDYGGDDIYLPNSTAGKFNVARLTPIITIEVEDIWVWEIEVLNVTVNAPGTVFVTVNGITVEILLENGVVTTDVLKATAKPDYKGNATWNIINLPVGTYPAYALYPGNENYTSVDTSDVFHVRDVMPSTVVVTADDIHVGENAIININVGPKGVTGSVVVNVEGKNYTLTIKNGKAKLIVPGLNVGVKNVSVWYKGNTYYLPSGNATTFNVLKVKPTVDIVAPEITVGENGIITVNVPSDATGNISIEIEGKQYTSEIKNGKAVFKISNLTEGVHDIKAYYSGDEKYLPANATGSIKVNPIGENKTDEHSFHEGIVLSDYPTGNPIFVLLLIILVIGSAQIRRFKK